jgi:phosphomannomutase/phosphoglucomutase
MWKSGHAYMKQKLKETSAQLAGEFSGHFFFGERWYGFDDGLYAAARLAEILSTTDCPLDDLLLEFPETVNTPEIRLAADDLTKFKTVDNIIQKGDFAPGKVNTLDGIGVDYEDGWGLVRASNTMPVLTLRFEANDADGLMRIQEQFRQQLAAHAPNISVDF